MKVILLHLLFFLGTNHTVIGQVTLDTVQHNHSHDHDTFYIITENEMKRFKFLGNSWYTGLSYNFSRSHEFSFSAGRTYGKSFCGGAGCYFNLASWGLNYSITTDSKQFAGIFAEYALFYYPPVAGRIDYFIDLENNNHYVRPSIGLSFLVLDFLYNYSFMIVGEENEFKHGVTVRFKYFPNNKNWEKRYPNRC